MPHPAPAISSGDAVQTSDGSITVDIFGQGFSPQSTVLLNDSPSPTTWLSNTQLQATLSPTTEHVSSITAVVSNPAPNSAISNALVFAISGNDAASQPAPASFQSQIGCENPNNGTSTGAWGPQDANYMDVDYGLQLIRSPQYTSNSIFWVSHETAPGQSILMTGAFTSSAKTAKIARIPAGTQNWQSLVEQSNTILPATQIGVTGLTLVVPSSFPQGVYGFEIVDPSAPPVISLANVPTVNWSIGIPSVTDPALALQHNVYHCGAEPGEVLRLFGRNLSSSDRVVLQSPGGRVYSIAPSFADANSISAPLPATLPVGTYTAWVGNAPWDAASSQPFLVTIVPSPTLMTATFECASLIGDGQTDNTALLQACLDNFAPEANSNYISYIDIPAGAFFLTGAITLHSYEVLLGQSPASTQFIGNAQATPPTAWINAPNHIGLAGFSLTAPVNPYLFVSSNQSGSVFVNNVDFEATTDYTNGHEISFWVSGPDVQIYNSTFHTSPSASTLTAAVNFGADLGDGAIISGNTFIDSNSFSQVRNGQNVIAESNTSYSEDGPGVNGGMGFDIGRAFTVYSPSDVTRNIYLGYNSFHDIGWPNQQAVTTDGGAGGYFGYVAASTLNTVTLADDPSWVWTGTSYPQATAIEIVAGTGVGQYSLISSINGRTIGIETPWTVPPDASSIVQISDPKINLTISHNTFTDTMGVAFDLFGTGIDSVIEDNVLTDAGQGIQVWGFGPYGGYQNYFSTFNTEVYRNIFSVGSGEWIMQKTTNSGAGLGIGDQPGCVVSGLLFRKNVIPSDQAIYVTNGVNGISANLVEDNQAVIFNLSQYLDYGFLVQGNVPPQPAN
jgi:hypothetical protein